MNKENQNQALELDTYAGQTPDIGYAAAQHYPEKFKTHLREMNEIVEITIEECRDDDQRMRFSVKVAVREYPESAVTTQVLSDGSLSDLILTANAFQMTLDEVVDWGIKTIADHESRVEEVCYCCKTNVLRKVL